LSLAGSPPVVRSDALRWFVPLPKQLDFVNWWASESMYAGGVGSGKTLSGAMKGVLACIRWPGTVGLVGRQSYRALEDTTKKVYLDGDDKPPVVPAELVASRSEGDNTVTLVNGSQILFRAFQDFNIEKLLSLNLGWFHVDEASETTLKVWLTLLGRLRHPAGPRVGWGSTNPNGRDWVWQRFHPDSEQQVGQLFHAPTEENVHLPADYIVRLRRMPAMWQARFVDASFETAAGMIWPEWNSAVHVCAPFDVPDHWDRFESLDHGRRNPTAVLWWATDPDGNLVVTDGYYSPGLVSEHADAILAVRRGRRFPPVAADPSVFVAGFDNKTVADEYRKHGIRLGRASNNVDAGLLRVSERLTRQAGVSFPDWHRWGGGLGPDGRGSPRLFVFDVPGTGPLREEVADYRWRELSPAMEARADQPEEPRKKDDHACDALRYGVMRDRHEAKLSVPRRRMPVVGEYDRATLPSQLGGM
jgi:Phage terminase large subunit